MATEAIWAFIREAQETGYERGLCGAAASELAALEASNEAKAARIAELEAEGEVHYNLIRLQQKRMRPAEGMWRKATGSLDTTYPDLGELIEWLLARIAVLREVLAKCLRYVERQRQTAYRFEVQGAIESALTTAPSGMVAVERERLKEIESSSWDIREKRKACPVCGYPIRDIQGHAHDCWLASKLKEVKHA